MHQRQTLADVGKRADDGDQQNGTRAAASGGVASYMAAVAPARPARTKKCQGRNEPPSVEVSELIVQARIEIGVFRLRQ